MSNKLTEEKLEQVYIESLNCEYSKYQIVENVYPLITKYEVFKEILEVVENFIMSIKQRIEKITKNLGAI